MPCPIWLLIQKVLSSLSKQQQLISSIINQLNVQLGVEISKIHILGCYSGAVVGGISFMLCISHNQKMHVYLIK